MLTVFLIFAKFKQTTLTASQVPVVNSLLQLKWEQAQIDFSLTLTGILLEYWETKHSKDERVIKSVHELFDCPSYMYKIMRKMYKIRLQRDFLKLVANDRSDKRDEAFLLTSKFWP